MVLGACLRLNRTQKFTGGVPGRFESIMFRHHGRNVTGSVQILSLGHNYTDLAVVCRRLHHIKIEYSFPSEYLTGILEPVMKHIRVKLADRITVLDRNLLRIPDKTKGFFSPPYTWNIDT